MSTVQLKDLSPEDRAELAKQIEAEKQAEKQKKLTYKQIVSDTVNSVFERLQAAADMLGDSKQNAFNELNALLDTKLEVYDVPDNQKTHTFTNTDGSKRIVIGVQPVSRWDGTESAGIEKITQFVNSLIHDTNSEKLVSMVMNFLKKDRAGYLNPNRVLELYKLKDEINDPLFTEGVEIIMAAYAPVDSSKFIEAYEKAPDGKFKNLELRFATIKVDVANKAEGGVE